MMKFLGRRGLAAAMGIFAFSISATGASAQSATSAPAQAAGDLKVPAVSYSLNSAQTSALATAAPMTAAMSAVQTVGGSLVRNSSIGIEAAWLYQGGWPLYALVDRYATNAQLDEQMTCLATAVFFEARGESLEGQIAVAKVVMNRTASTKYPDSWCETVKQPWQFSFVQKGQFPRVDINSYSWAKAQSVALLAASGAIPTLQDDVLWYHADYVAPAWGPRLHKVSKIGAHIFYRA